MKTSGTSAFTDIATQSSPQCSPERDPLTASSSPRLNEDHARSVTSADAAEDAHGPAAAETDLGRRIQLYRELWESDRKKKNNRLRESKRRIERFEYAAQIRETEQREVRSYLPSTPDRRKQQKAASKARRDAARSEEEREAIRKKDRERKARKREEERIIAELEALDFDLE